ncbi:MAG: FxsA family protein [Ornithinimicrobium sp.]
MSTAQSSATGPRRQGRRVGRWIFLVLLLIPLLEITTIILVGQAVGPWWTFGALIALSVLGAWLVHREGRRTWHRLREVLRRGHPPAKELTDAGLVLVGGALLLTPGFLTDALGLFFILPLTRPITRVWLQAVVASRLLGEFGHGRPGQGAGRGKNPPRAGRGEIIEGEIIDESPRGAADPGDPTGGATSGDR